jgi:regulator of replication initiation timing
MARSIREISTSGQAGNELELYQQLVELQKEIIRLAQQNERAELECTKLREQMAAEVSGRREARRSVWRKANGALVQLPGITTVKADLVSLLNKQTSTC